MNIELGKKMYSWATHLWPINRSLTGDGVRETLSYLKTLLPELKIKDIESGTKVFDWTVPDEWNVKEAYIDDDKGNRIVDFKLNNLHLVGYSEPVDKWVDLEELNDHLYSLPDMPKAIPYVTSYYSKQWGFCLTQQQRDELNSKLYHVVIKSDISRGRLNYAELLIPGECDKEIFLSTYICHPSMANNELSGPVVTTALAKWIKSKKNTKYSYRIIFIPETIGSIVYLSKNLNTLKNNVIAGYNVTCVGDDRCFSFLPSRKGNSLSDRAALHALKYIDKYFIKYTWLDRGSDERQYCAPGVDLPVSSIMRSKYGEYPEYHTSLDDLSLVTPTGLEGGFNAIKNAIEIIEKNTIPVVNVCCEPQLGRRDLYPSVSKQGIDETTRSIRDFISYCDGSNTLLDIAEKIDKPFTHVKNIMDILIQHDLISTKSKC